MSNPRSAKAGEGASGRAGTSADLPTLEEIHLDGEMDDSVEIYGMIGS
jgi:hypothetical protein